jgi:hypothetical protein
MKSQLFKKEIPIHLLKDLLNSICERTETTEYIVTIESFKKGEYLNLILPFFQSLHSYYHDSKKKFVEKQIITYKSFLTVLRQICNYHGIPFTSQIKYEKSNYIIVYKIYQQLFEEKTLN